MCTDLANTYNEIKVIILIGTFKFFWYSYFTFSSYLIM